MNIVLVSFAAFGGLFTALFIYWKRARGPMVCMIGESCDNVLRSRYATIFFGIPNEIIGALFFGGILVFLGTRSFFDMFTDPLFDALLILGAGLGALYALYLTGIQAFVLKKLCEKCLILSFFTFLTFVFVLFF